LAVWTAKAFLRKVETSLAYIKQRKKRKMKERIEEILADLVDGCITREEAVIAILALVEG